MIAMGAYPMVVKLHILFPILFVRPVPRFVVATVFAAAAKPLLAASKIAATVVMESVILPLKVHIVVTKIVAESVVRITVNVMDMAIVVSVLISGFPEAIVAAATVIAKAVLMINTTVICVVIG